MRICLPDLKKKKNVIPMILPPVEMKKNWVSGSCRASAPQESFRNQMSRAETFCSHNLFQMLIAWACISAGTKKLFSLLSVTSYSSFAFHKVSVTVYNSECLSALLRTGAVPLTWHVHQDTHFLLLSPQFLAWKMLTLASFLCITATV